MKEYFLTYLKIVLLQKLQNCEHRILIGIHICTIIITLLYYNNREKQTEIVTNQLTQLAVQAEANQSQLKYIPIYSFSPE